MEVRFYGSLRWYTGSFSTQVWAKRMNIVQNGHFSLYPERSPLISIGELCFSLLYAAFPRLKFVGKIDLPILKPIITEKRPYIGTILQLTYRMQFVLFSFLFFSFFSFFFSFHPFDILYLCISVLRVDKRY